MLGQKIEIDKSFDKIATFMLLKQKLVTFS